MSTSFYRAFEEKYRGPRELIKSRLKVYLPFVQPLRQAYPEGRALDLGCGRGEWLELLGDQGFDAIGVDLDVGMLQACRERNLNVETADAVAYMKGLPASSLCVVSGFHIAEHLPFEILQQLVQEALRVLVPGGLLILETPNPENIGVGTSSFYLDPTHQRPIPPELLSFLAEHYGFARFKVLRLQESEHLHGESHVRLLDVLSGVSPDYAVVAQKESGTLVMENLTPVFNQTYGLTLTHLALRHEQVFENRLTAVATKAQQALDQAMYAEDLALRHEQVFENRLTAVATKAQQALDQAMYAEAKASQAESHAKQAEIVANQRLVELQSIYASTTWRLTAPLRWVTGQGRRLRNEGVKSRLNASIKKLFRYLISTMSAHPRLYASIKKLNSKTGIGDFILAQVGLRVAIKSPACNPPRTVKRKRVSAAEIESVSVLFDNKDVQRLLAIRGDINSHAGYAKACNLYKNMLLFDYDQVVGVDLHAHPSTNANNWDGLQISEDQLHTLCSLGKCDINIITISSPDDFVKYEGAKNIGLFFWETDRVGRRHWIDAINQLDELWLPAQFMQHALRREGVHISMKLVPVPLDEKIMYARNQHIERPKTIWQLGKRSQEPALVNYDSIPSYKFKLLTTNTLIGRKGYPVLLSELSRLQECDNVALIIKASSVDVRHDESYLLREIKKYTDLMNVQIDVYVLHKSLSEAEMAAVEDDCEVFVTCTYGEGFGLGVFQMYYSGKPVICARHTALMESLPHDYPYFMECEMQNVSLIDPVNVYPVSAKWGIPREGELLRALNKVLHNK